MEKDTLRSFGFLANAMGGGGDIGQAFPASDAQDLMDGADYIPGEVTIARRIGESVKYDRHAKTWTFADGTVTN